MARTPFFGALFSAAALCATATHAEEHEVLILGSGFFPGIIYADTGDTIRFVNVSDNPQYLIGDDDRWAIGPIANDAEQVLNVIPGLLNRFISTTEPDKSYDDFNGEDQPEAAIGTMSYGQPPLG
ncbi:MAG: hypothetical protein AAFY38_13525 [Pseudomonadota bacterium]